MHDLYVAYYVFGNHWQLIMHSLGCWELYVVLVENRKCNFINAIASSLLYPYILITWAHKGSSIYTVGSTNSHNTAGMHT